MSSGHVRNGPGDQTPLGPGSVNNITVDVAEHSATSQRHTPAPFSHQQPSHMGDITAQSEAGDSYAVPPNQQQVFMTNVLIQLESIQSKLNILQHTTREVIIARQELIERKIDTVESRIENIQNAVPQVSQSPGMPLTAEAFQQFPGLASRYVPSNPDHQALMSAIVAAIQDPSRATAQQIQQSAQHIRGMSPGNNATPKRRKMSGPRDSVNEIQEIGGETLLSVGTVQPPEVIMSTMKQPLVNGTSPIRAPGPNNLLVRQPSISMAGAPAKVSAFNNSLRVGNTASIPSPMGIGPSPRHSSPFGPITSLASLPIPIGSPTVNKTAPVTPMATSSPTPQHILNHTIPTLSLPRAHSNTSALSMRPMALPPPPVSPAASLASLQQSTAGSFTFTNNHNGYAKRNRDSILERTIRANGINTGLSNGNALHLIAKTEPSLAAQLAGHGPNSNSSSTTSSIGMNLPLKHQETVLTPNQIASTLSSPLARNLRAFVPNNLINSTNLYLDPTGVSSRHLAPLRNTDMHVTNVQAASMPLNFDIVQHANHGNMLMTQSSMNSVVGHTNGEIDNTNEQFSNVKRHMTQIQRLVTEHASKHGESCKFVKDFALYKSIWELNRLSKKNPHVSLMKKMLQELPEQDWPTSEVKGYVEGSIKKSEMPNTQIYLLNELLAKFYDCYKQALLGSEHFRDDPDLHLSNEEFTKIMVTSFAIRNRQPQTQAKLQRKMESEILKSELLKIQN